jgi:hypothetical protein
MCECVGIIDFPRLSLGFALVNDSDLLCDSDSLSCSFS